MAAATRTFTVMDTPPRVWTVLSDLPRWNRLFGMDDARKRGWGDRFALQSAPARGGRLTMTDAEGRAFQEWEIEEWIPGQKLRLASRKTLCANTMAEMESVIEASILPISALETQVELRFNAKFSHPVWSLMLALIPLKGQLSRVLFRMEKGLIAALSGA
jgi:hypothetical protein